MSTAETENLAPNTATDLRAAVSGQMDQLARAMTTGKGGLGEAGRQPGPAVLKYRPDIDGLRAVAVLPVVLFHAGVSLFGGGFVGVDVFFVISGFLITGIIIGDIEQERYSVARFYERRIRRIAPAYLVTVALTLAVALFVMLPDDLAELGDSAFWSALMASNVFFWAQSNEYFNGADDLKPLLHTWSLSIEEQFYLLFPIVLLVLRRLGVWRHAPILCALAALVSLGLSIYGTAYTPVASFYLLPTRAWELLVGSLLAFGLFPASGRRLAGWEALAGLALILGSACLYTATTPFPGLAALPPVVGAALIIHSGLGSPAEERSSVVTRLLASPPLRFIGLISYSLYLLHWPIVVFMKYYFFEIDAYQQIFIVAASILLAFLSWKFVEQPARSGKLLLARPQLFLAAGTGIAAIALAGWTAYAMDGLPGRIPQQIQVLASKKSHQGPWRDCGAVFKDRKTIEDLCVLGAGGQEPDFAVLGDSHANAVAAAIFEAAASAGRAGYQISDNGYRPLLDFVKFGEEEKYRYLNKLVKDLLASKPSVKDLIVAVYWRQATLVDGYYDARGRFTDGVTAMRDGMLELVQGHPDKRFLFVLPTANSVLFGANAAGRAAWLGGPFNPVVDVAEFRRVAAGYAGVIAALRAQPNVQFLDLSSRICDDKVCHGVLNGELVFTDDNHLSYDAAKLFEPDFSLFLGGSSNSAAATTLRAAGIGGSEPPMKKQEWSE